MMGTNDEQKLCVVSKKEDLLPEIDRKDDNVDIKDDQTITDPPPLCGSYRLFIAFIGCMIMCLSLASQTSMSSAMVCMIKDDDNDHTNGSVGYNITRVSDYNGTLIDDQPWKFSWGSETKSLVLASFFIGYCITQLPAGIVVSKFGPKRSMVIALFSSAIWHILTVPAARWNLPALYTARFLAGISNGFLLPSMYALLANWTPRQEISRLFAIGNAGLELGNSFSFFISLFGCEVDFQGGWTVVLYTIGSSQIVVGVVILLLGVTDFPSTNRILSQKEATYIAENSSYGDSKRNESIPVGKILRSPPVWAFCLSQFGTEWLFYTVITQGAIYMRDFLRFTPQKTNLVSSIPFLATIPSVYVAGFVADTLTGKGLLSLTQVRKMNDILAKLLPASALVMLGFAGNWIVVFFLYLLVALGMLSTYAGYMANPADLSPAHAGFLASLGQALSMWVAFVIPVMSGALTQEGNREGWLIVFFIAAGISVMSMLSFLLFGSAELQPWAKADDIDVNEETPINWKESGGVVDTKFYTQ